MEVAELVNFGLGGVVIGLFVAGFIVGRKEHDRVIAERDRAWERADALVDDVHTNVAPALERATEAIKAREHFEERVLEVLTDVRRLLEGRDR